ncbi:MAG: hypothetical protein JKY93_10390 [Gammaproteobacteria bacterium]|nr:hypothetical protein [Gammaproteobacteria bacterium]
MKRPEKYVGVDNEVNGGMTPLAKIIRDAWVFGILEESETCAGWNAAGMDNLMSKVNDEWDKYGCLVSYLPPELAAKHKRIHDKAIAEAKAVGWSGATETDDEG